MNRRNTLKALVLGSASTSLLAGACKSADEKAQASVQPASAGPDRMAEEKAHMEKLDKEPDFFSQHELKTLTVLSDYIIPKDEVSGSASDAGVPAFLAFIVKDMPDHQTPLRGGLQWVDAQCRKRFGQVFVDCQPQDQTTLLDEMAYPERKVAGSGPGVRFFNRLRNLVATGFFTSQMGVKDLGYAGNQPNQWKGVPDDVLKEFGLAYTEWELANCA